MRVVLMLLLLVAAAPARAEWVKVSQTTRETFYIDPATIRRDGNLRSVVVMQDLDQRGPDGAMSRQAMDEYDCTSRTRRLLAIHQYSGRMAGGQIIGSESTPTAWNPIPAGTHALTVLRIVCAR
jgi:hypothetical protein